MTVAPHHLTMPALDTPVSPGSGTDASASSSNDILHPTDFMTLLVAQLKNQDPTQPMDPTQFVSQLVQFNSLEQLIGINQDLAAPAPTPSSTPSTPAPPAKS